MKRIKNIQTEQLIKELKTLAIKENVKFWKRIATELEKPSNNRRIVNISKIDKLSKEGEIILVPGKVLSSGELTHKVTITAYAFSDSAKSKILAVGKVLSLNELMKENPKAKGIRILG